MIRAPEVDVAAETTKFLDSFKLVPVKAARVDPFSSEDQSPAAAKPDGKPKTDGGK